MRESFIVFFFFLYWWSHNCKNGSSFLPVNMWKAYLGQSQSQTRHRWPEVSFSPQPLKTLWCFVSGKLKQFWLLFSVAKHLNIVFPVCSVLPSVICALTALWWEQFWHVYWRTNSRSAWISSVIWGWGYEMKSERSQVISGKMMYIFEILATPVSDILFLVLLSYPFFIVLKSSPHLKLALWLCTFKWKTNPFNLILSMSWTSLFRFNNFPADFEYIFYIWNF